jgi:hypothetical protein
MKVISDFSVRLDRDATPPRVELLKHGVATGLRIEAVNLLSQFQTSHGDVLLVFDEDSPYEEALHFCLLRHEQLIDHLLYGAPYTSGIFKLVRVQDDQLFFTFASDEVLCLRVNTEGSRWPQRNAPGASHVTGVFGRRFLNLKVQG